MVTKSFCNEWKWWQSIRVTDRYYRGTRVCLLSLRLKFKKILKKFYKFFVESKFWFWNFFLIFYFRFLNFFQNYFFRICYHFIFSCSITLSIEKCRSNQNRVFLLVRIPPTPLSLICRFIGSRDSLSGYKNKLGVLSSRSCFLGSVDVGSNFFLFLSFFTPDPI